MKPKKMSLVLVLFLFILPLSSLSLLGLFKAKNIFTNHTTNNNNLAQNIVAEQKTKTSPNPKPHPLNQQPNDLSINNNLSIKNGAPKKNGALAKNNLSIENAPSIENNLSINNGSPKKNDSPKKNNPSAKNNLSTKNGAPTKKAKFLSLKAKKANMRVGPGAHYPLILQFQLKSLPLKWLDTHHHWHKLEAPNGQKGWMHQSLLSAKRTILIVPKDKPYSALYKTNKAEKIKAHLEQYVVGGLLSCVQLYCEIKLDKQTGWVLREDIFGVEDYEFQH